MTRAPIMNLVDQLAFCRDGTVWATWRLRPLPYGYQSLGDKLAVRDHHTQLYRALKGEFLLQGVLAPKDPTQVVDAMLHGVDLNTSPAWAEECYETLERLTENPIGQRLFYLSTPLRVGGAAGLVRGSMRVAWNGMIDALGLPRDGVGRSTARRYLVRAEEFRAQLPPAFFATPASAAEQIWLHRRAQIRGVFDGFPSPIDDRQITEELLTHGAGALGSPNLDEGARSDLKRGALFNPLGRRYLKVTADTEEVAYQSLMTLADVPAHGVAEIGSEFLGRIDESGVDVDWAIRGRVRTQQEVLRRNKRAKNTLEDQVGQRADDTTSSGKLHRSLLAMQDYEDLMLANDQEVEVDSATVLACSGATAEEANDAAVAVQTYFRDNGFKVVRPPGGQMQQWQAMMPGYSLAQLMLVREKQLIAPATSMSVAMPVISAEIGDKHGAMFALNITTPRPTPVLFDITGNSERDISGSIAICGELGSGKSVAMKKITGDVVDRGGRFVATDGTRTGEWATFASSVSGATIVNVRNPTVGLDPLRLFGPIDGIPIVKSFLAMLLNIELLGPEGLLLSHLLKPTYLTRHGIDSLGALLAHLTSDCDLAGAKELASRMDVFADLDTPEAGVARIVFDPTLEPLDLDSRAIVFWTHGTKQPTRDELLHAHLTRNLGLDKLFGRALFGLIAKIAEQICCSDPTDPALFAVDETHAITLSSEGEAVLIDFVRQGRRQAAGLLLGSHNPDEDFGQRTDKNQDLENDMGGSTLAALIPVRIVLRHRDVGLAKKALRWLGLDPTDPDLVKLITEETSPVEDENEYSNSNGGVREERRGEGIMRDSLNRFARIKVMLPLNEKRRETILTTPKRAPR